jgi:integrase
LLLASLVFLSRGGLRLSEVTNLRIADIHSDRLQVFVKGGKGKKDRYTTLSGRFLTALRDCYTIVGHTR